MSLFQKSIIRSEEQKISDSKIKEHWNAYRNYFHNKKVQLDLISIKEQGNQTTFLVKTFCNIFGYTLNEAGVDGNLFREVGKSEFADGAIKKDGEVVAVIELKSSKTKNLKDIEDQVFKYQSRYNCNYAITSNFYKLRFYINSSSEYEEFDLFNLDISRFKVLWICLSKTNLFNDLPRKLKDKSLVEEKIVTNSLYRDYSDFRKDLFKDLKKNNPSVSEIDLLNSTQKLLDRLLFIFFGEDKGLLPENLISEIIGRWQNRVDYGDLGDDEYLYHHFQNYFQLINKGRKAKNNIGEIFPYNGGLFKEDGLLNSLIISDETLKKHTLKLTSYDFESDISVNILGHIFEHSLTEIEDLQNQIQGRELDKAISKRKKDGVFYTPQYITKYIVDNTVGKLCEEKKIELNIIEDEYLKGRKGRQKNKLKLLKDTLEEYRSWLLGLTICDPACGSGAFLNQALDFLISEHSYVDELQNSLLGGGFNFPEVENSILENNLYGVDINKESVEIAKLSLWLRTAQKGRKLTSLNNNLKCGNSLIDDPEVAGDKAFNWQEEFPEVFEKGGFDVIIGNPPYVSSKGENFSDTEKQFFIRNYQCAVYQIDLYLLFNEKSLLISNQKGFISLIEPNAWMNNLFLKPIREFLLDKTTIYEIVNTPIGVFKDATVDTVILTFGKKSKTLVPIKISEAKGQDIIYLHSKDAVSFKDNENIDFDILVSQEAKQILSKLEIKKVNLIDISIASSGIKEYEKGKGNPPQTSEDVRNKPFNSYCKIDDSYQKHISGSDVKRYILNWQGNYLKYGEWIAAPRNPIFFEGERLIIREIPGKKSLIVSHTSENYTVKNTAHIFKIENSDYSIFGLLGILNSKLLGFYFRNKFSENDDVFPKAKLGQCKKLPISINLKKNINFDKPVKKMISSLDKVNTLSKSFSTHLSSKLNISNPSKKLQNWHELDIGDFLNELEKSLKKFAKENETEYCKLTLNEEAKWMQYFIEQQEKAEELKMEIDETDKEIDQMVYELYGLTKEEIEIVENATK